MPGRNCKSSASIPLISLAAVHARAAIDREAGITWSKAHFESGIGSAAIAVFDYTGEPVAAINVSGPVASFTGAKRQKQIEAELRRAGREISVRLGWLDPAAAKIGG